jgi:hypothetical protein
MRGVVDLVVISLILVLILSSGCSLTKKEPRTGPDAAVLTFDRKRPKGLAVSERWVVTRKENETYLLHAYDVERRRRKQVCGAVLPKASMAGWNDLARAGLLVPGEDLRYQAPRGAEPFVGRYFLNLSDMGRNVIARRPLVAGEAEALLGVLQRWEAATQRMGNLRLPSAIRVEMVMGGCDMRGEPLAERVGVDK